MTRSLISLARCEFEELLAEKELDVTALSGRDIETLNQWVRRAMFDEEVQAARLAVILAGELQESTEGYQISPPTIPEIEKWSEKAEEMVSTEYVDIHYLLV